MQAASRPAKKLVLGVIGGSGLYQMSGIEITGEHQVETPYGKPSDLIIEARLGNRDVFFLPRHGRGHLFTPSEVNYRANIYALKTFGVTHVLAISAVGIMREEIRPGDMVVPDQIYDRTKGIRASTFFGEGIVGHVSFADPFCDEMRQWILAAARAEKAVVHAGGTYVCMEGPQFSTRAESHYYRATLKPAVIGMTALPEAKLAREAEMCYGMLALATDYDCWHETEEDVSVEAVLDVVRRNSTLANSIVKKLAGSLPDTSSSPLLYAAQYAVMTDRKKIPTASRQKTSLLWGQYLEGN